MRATYRRELLELMLIGVPMLLGAVFAAWEFTGFWGDMEDMVGTALLAGVALGIAQGALDRVRRNDQFFLHRPQSAVKLHAARTLAGLTVSVVSWGAFVGLFELFTRMREANTRDVIYPIFPGRPSWAREWFHLEWSESLLILALMLLAWAAMRFVVAARSLRGAFLLLLIVPWLVMSLATRLGSPLQAALPVFAFVALLVASQVVNLAGDTP